MLSYKTIFDVRAIHTPLTALDRWQGIYCIEENNWSDTFKLSYFCTRETKLQSLQFKIMHRIIPCKKWLRDKKVINSPSCEMCKEDDMTHHFTECSGLNNLWNIFENWWNRTSTYQIQLSNKLIMFGIYYDDTFYKNVNYVILLAKWYIHRQVYLAQNVDFFNFLIVLKITWTLKNTYAHVMVDCILLTYMRYMNVFNWLLFNSLLNCLCLVLL